MEAAITLPAGPSAGLFAEVGGAMYRRTLRVLANHEAAVRASEALFVRFVVHARTQEMDERARWNWIYRVATSHALRQLPDDARPGAGQNGQNGQDGQDGALPPMRTLRRVGEAGQNILVFTLLDGLTAAEIADVLGVPSKVVQQRLKDALAAAGMAADSLAAAAGTDAAAHPSRLALDSDRPAHRDHVAACPRCAAIVDESDRLARSFARDVAPGAVPRVAAAVRVARSRRASGPRWTRILWLAGGFIVVAVLALVVARPRAPRREASPYAGVKGASRVKAAGIQISVGRDAEISALAPGSPVRPGDRLSFRVKAEGPRYLELRIRRADGERRIFPVGVAGAALVQPGQALGTAYLVDPPTAAQPAPGGNSSAQAAQRGQAAIWVIGRFADHPFALDQPPGPDIQVVPVRIAIDEGAAAAPAPAH